MLRIVPFLPLGYGRLTCTLYLCPVFGEYYNQRRFAPTERWPVSIGTSGRFGAEQLAEFSGISRIAFTINQKRKKYEK
jgi:hypothetical protein